MRSVEITTIIVSRNFLKSRQAKIDEMSSHPEIYSQEQQETYWQDHQAITGPGVGLFYAKTFRDPYEPIYICQSSVDCEKIRFSDKYYDIINNRPPRCNDLTGITIWYVGCNSKEEAMALKDALMLYIVPTLHKNSNVTFRRLVKKRKESATLLHQLVIDGWPNSRLVKPISEL